MSAHSWGMYGPSFYPPPPLDTSEFYTPQPLGELYEPLPLTSYVTQAQPPLTLGGEDELVLAADPYYLYGDRGGQDGSSAANQAFVANTLGSPITEGSPSYSLMRQIQSGIYQCTSAVSVSGAPERLDPHLHFETHKEKSEVAPGAVFPNTPGAHWVDYGGLCFASLRKVLGVDTDDYHAQLCSTLWTEIVTPGKSKALLYFAGHQYVIKTTTKAESKHLRRMLFNYHRHMHENPHSLLPHFLGHHAIIAQHTNGNGNGNGGGGGANGGKLRFVVMKNVFQTTNVIQRRYDLKGSTVNRTASDRERQKESPTFLDNDVDRCLYLGEERRQIFMQQLRRDTNFLMSNAVMDYSLLVGIHWPAPTLTTTTTNNTSDYGANNNNNNNNISDSSDTGWDSSPEACLRADQGGMACQGSAAEGVEAGSEVYYVGVIDILQNYNTRKQLETLYKRARVGSGISCVPPREYGNRFLKYINSILL